MDDRCIVSHLKFQQTLLYLLREADQQQKQVQLVHSGVNKTTSKQFLWFRSGDQKAWIWYKRAGTFASFVWLMIPLFWSEKKFVIIIGSRCICVLCPVSGQWFLCSGPKRTLWLLLARGAHCTCVLCLVNDWVSLTCRCRSKGSQRAATPRQRLKRKLGQSQ